MNALEQSLLQSLEISSQDSVKKSKLPKTIECEVNNVEDVAIGLYNVSYMGNNFNVYSSSPSTTYNEKDIVLVLVPEGDFSKTKYILGAVSPNGNMYAAAGQTAQDRIVFDVNLLPFSDISLCSYTPTNNEITFSQGSDFIDLLKNYVKDFNNLTFTAKVKTQLPGEQQVRGNYGLILNIPVNLADPEGNIDTSVESWVCVRMDISTMEGDVYNFNEFSQQSIDFTFPTNATYDDSRNPTILAIVDNFIERDNQPDDIFFTDIGLRVVDYLPLNENEGNFLTIVASEGNFFINSLNFSDSKTLTPVLRIDGKDKKVSDYDCYWFVEDTSVRIGSDGYQHYGGEFWRCLNGKTNVETNDDGTETFQWITDVPELIVYQDDILSSLKYKCVLVKDKFYIKGEIEIKNLQATYETDLTTANGATHFNKDTGTINLIARIKEIIPPVGADYTTSLSTVWQRIDKNGIPIEETSTTFKKVRINDLVNGWYEIEVSYPCSSVDQINLIKCTFYQETIKNGAVVNKNIATEEISVTTGEDFVYKISVELDKDVYKYDANGNSPMVSNYDGPASSIVKEIKPIYFRIFDSDGKELSETEYKYCDVTWQIPKNSMITYSGTVTSESDDYIYVKKNGQINSGLYFGIRNIFDPKRDDNVVILTISYQGYILRENIPIRFLKDGEAGTNGSKYSAVITYNDFAYGEKQWLDGRPFINNIVPVFVKPSNSRYGYCEAFGYYKARYFNGEEYEYNKIIEGDYETPYLEVKVYKDGNLLPDNSSIYTVEWSMLDPAINFPNFEVSSSGRVECTNPNQIDAHGTQGGYTINIVKAKITIKSDATDSNRQEELYAYYPIDHIVINIPSGDVFSFDYEYVVPVIEDGFWTAEYASDGTNPQYNNSAPFKLTTYSRVTDMTQYFYNCNGGGSPNEDFTIDSSEDWTILKAHPAPKYDNGKTNNFIEFFSEYYHVDPYDEYEDESDYPPETIEGAIYLKEEEIEELTQLCNLYRSICSNLDLFQHQLDNEEIFSYNIYRGYLENSKNMLTSRSYIFSYINKILETLNKISDYCAGKTVSITPSISDSIAFINQIKSNLYYLGDPDITVRTDYNDIYDYLVASGITELTFNNTQDYKTAYGLGSYAILNDYILQCNELLASYFQEISVLKTYTAALTNFTLLREKLDDYLNDNAVLTFLTERQDLCEEFKTYKNQLAVLFNNLSNLYYSYDDVDIKVIKKFKIAHDEFNEEYYYNKYNELANQKLYQLEYANLELSDLIGALHLNSTSYRRPIVFLFNRYEKSNLNNWDGTKIYVDENNQQYILAPQLGAGFKENDNSYTGLVMGINTVKAIQDSYYYSGQQRIGLLALDHGIQTMFINARNGSAVFGKSGPGQIILDPTQDEAMLYSSNYWNNYDGSTGMPINYSSNNISYKGMLINLTDSYIHFGNRLTREPLEVNTLDDLVYSINNELERLGLSYRITKGVLSNFWSYYGSGPVYVAIDSVGQIAVCYISPTQSGVDFSDYSLEIDSGYNSYLHFYLNYGSHPDIYFRYVYKKFEYSNGQYNESYSDDYSNYADYIGRIPYSDSSSRCINIDGYFIVAPKNNLAGKKYYIREVDVFKGGKLYSGTHDALTSTSDGFFLNEEGLSIGSKFKATSTGVLTLGDGAVAGGGIHWTIDSDSNHSYIGYNTDDLYFNINMGMLSGAAANQVYLGTNGLRLGDKFAVTKDGYMFGSSGKIGGWTISANALSAGNMSISSTGSMSGPGWSISAAGTATFGNLIANGTGTIGGWTIGSGTLTSGSLVLSGADGSINGYGFILDSTGLKLRKNNVTKLNFDSSGNLTITGTINATAGQFGNYWQVNADGLIYTGTTVVGQASKITPSTVAADTGYFNNINTTSQQTGAFGGQATIGTVRAGNLLFFDNETNNYVNILSRLSDRYYTKTETDQAIAAAIASIDLSNYYTKTEADGTFSLRGHTHDTRYASISHTHHFSGSGNDTINVQGDGQYYVHIGISGNTEGPQ